jgi:hypothetical protein
MSKDTKRKPGPIDVRQYDMAPFWLGIPTFFHQPIALTPEDLKAGKVEVAMLGAYIAWPIPACRKATSFTYCKARARSRGIAFGGSS